VQIAQLSDGANHPAELFTQFAIARGTQRRDWQPVGAQAPQVLRSLAEHALPLPCTPGFQRTVTLTVRASSNRPVRVHQKYAVMS
jgi:hypothetical protein